MATLFMLWRLIFSVVIDFLMRGGGCGTHGYAGHGRHDNYERHDSLKGWMRKDPVCGVERPVDQAPVSAEPAGKMYHVYSTAFLEEFLHDPVRYTTRPEPTAPTHHGA